MSMVSPTTRKSSLPTSTSTPGGHPSMSQSPPDTPLKTPRGLPTALPSDPKSDSTKPITLAPSDSSSPPTMHRSLSDSNRDRLPLQTLGETRMDPTFNFEDPKISSSTAAAAISRSDSSSFDRYKTGPASPVIPKSITDAEHALGLTDRVAEERKKSKQAEMERRRKGSGGSVRAQQQQQGWDDGPELRAPAPNRFREMLPQDSSGYESDARSLFGSYEPEVRGPRIFDEEDEEDEDEDDGQGPSRPRPQHTASDRRPNVDRPTVVKRSSIPSPSQQHPSQPAIDPDDELRLPIPPLRHARSAEHAAGLYSPSPYPARRGPEPDARDRRGNGGGRPARWNGEGYPSSPPPSAQEGSRGPMHHQSREGGGSDYSLPRRGGGNGNGSGGSGSGGGGDVDRIDHYYQHPQQQQQQRDLRRNQDSYYREHDQRRGDPANYFPAPPQHHAIQFPSDRAGGQRERYDSEYDEGLPTPTASSRSFSAAQAQSPSRGREAEPPMLPASFFGATGGGSTRGGGARPLDPRFQAFHQASKARSESYYTASEDGGMALSVGSRAEPEHYKGTIHNFPNLKDGSRVDGKTSLPITFIQRDLDHSISSLISKEVFAELLDDPMGRFRFREHLSREGKPASSALLAFYQDGKAYEKIMTEFKSLGVAIHETFLAPAALKEIDVPTETKEESLIALREAHRLKAPFTRAGQRAFDTLYATEFSTFIKKKITDQARVRLGLFTATQERGDLGDVFCLTNPRLPDHPIVMCSDGFIRLTGYPRNQLVGRNCRFLQGPSTNPESVQNLRNSLNTGVPCCELLLNYKADGTAFWNCLTMIPLKNSSGRVDYFIGGQINISGALASKQSLSFLVGASASDSAMSSVEDQHAIKIAQSGNADLELSSEVVSAVERQIGHASHLRAKEALGPGERPGGAVAAGLATDNDTSGRVGGFGNPSTPTGISKFFGKLRGKTILPGVFSSDGQRISGAEGMLGTQALPLDEQMSRFTEVYSKLFIFRHRKMEVIFVTPALLAYLGFSIASPKKMYASSLLHQDFTDLLCLPTKRETADLKRNVRKIVQTESAHSLRGGIRLSSKVRGARSAAVSDAVTEEGMRVTLGLMHLTPLKDQKGYVEAWACVFGG